MITVSESLVWRKSRRSSSQGDSCVEVASLPDGGSAVRDSKDTEGPALRFSPEEWRHFTAHLKD
ncbi:MAG: DUF397 domain-containing protein [Streptosporangiaceae bacterium]